MVPKSQLTDRHMPRTDEQIRAAHIGNAKPLNGRIVLVDYDPRWVGLFEREAGKIRAAVAEALRIEMSARRPSLVCQPSPYLTSFSS